jgi:deoxyribonuclease (pyrimidine dimer)
MTRVNLVHVEDLADQHLFSEWREIKMIPAKLKKLQETKLGGVIMRDVPSTYTLNTGHVRFFYDKMYFLYTRYNELTDELHKRNFNISHHDAASIFIDGIVSEMQNPLWEPTIPEIAINVERITLRLNERPNWYRYYGDVVPSMWFIDRYNQQMMVDKIVGV